MIAPRSIFQIVRRMQLKRSSESVQLSADIVRSILHPWVACSAPSACTLKPGIGEVKDNAAERFSTDINRGDFAALRF